MVGSEAACREALEGLAAAARVRAVGKVTAPRAVATVRAMAAAVAPTAEVGLAAEAMAGKMAMAAVMAAGAVPAGRQPVLRVERPAAASWAAGAAKVVVEMAAAVAATAMVAVAMVAVAAAERVAAGRAVAAAVETAMAAVEAAEAARLGPPRRPSIRHACLPSHRSTTPSCCRGLGATETGRRLRERLRQVAGRNRGSRIQMCSKSTLNPLHRRRNRCRSRIGILSSPSRRRTLRTAANRSRSRHPRTLPSRRGRPPHARCTAPSCRMVLGRRSRTIRRS